MIPIPTGARVWLVTGHTDMRKGFDGPALIVQETLKRAPHSSHLFVFRGRRDSLVKCLWSDGQGLCLFSKQLERGRFPWPSLADGTVTISTAQLFLSAFGHLLAHAAGDMAFDGCWIEKSVEDHKKGRLKRPILLFHLIRGRRSFLPSERP
jgi:transposase